MSSALMQNCGTRELNFERGQGSYLFTEEVACSLVAGTHGSTFGGNPLATAVGNAVMGTLNDVGFLRNVSK
jgi:acetylornithine/N-succinyldiaminopimelate aminotransferase